MPKRDDPAKLAAAEHFIEIAGSKAEAYRLIHAAKVRGSSGRPTKYFAADAHVLYAVEMLEREYRRAGVKPPKRRALIKKAVSRKLADGKQLGKTECTAIKRLERYSSLMEKLFSAKRPEDRVSLRELREFWASVESVSWDSADRTAIRQAGSTTGFRALSVRR